MLDCNKLKEKFGKLSVLVVGDMYLDIDYIGGYSGYSRDKEQLPIFRSETIKYSPGGGGNLAVCFATLGVKTTVSGYWGNTYDQNRYILEQHFRDHKILPAGMKFYGRTPTFGKLYLHNGQHIYRIDLISEPIPQDKREALVETIKILAPNNDFTACADYEEVNDYGVCSEEVIEVVRQLAKVKFATSRKNMRRFKEFDYIIQNQKEVRDDGINLTKYLNISEYVKYGLVVTYGGIGAKTYFPDTRMGDDIMSYSKELTENIDPCGCGDMFYAIYSSSVISGYDTTTCLQLANAGARCVARKLFGTGQSDCEEIAKEWEALYGSAM